MNAETPRSGWRTAHASVAGTSHEASGTPCQDYGRCHVVTNEHGGVLVAALADGAGSAKESETGAHFAVEHFIDGFVKQALADPTLSSIEDDTALQWMGVMRDALGHVAETSGHDISDYACTLLGIVAGASRTLLVQIGDGAMVIKDAEETKARVAFWPQHGEYANSTNFVTQDDFQRKLMVEIKEGPVEAFAMFTDGIERLVLDFATQTPHEPALRPIMDWVATSGSPEAEPAPSAALEAFLGSRQVNNRTDDDKSLLVATRAPQTRAEG